MIKKQADGIVDIIWKPDAGPAENILGLVEYGYMFLGGWGRIAALLANIAGMGLRDLGKKIDSLLSLNTLNDLANISDSANADALFKSSMPKHQDFIAKLGSIQVGSVTGLDLVFTSGLASQFKTSLALGKSRGYSIKDDKSALEHLKNYFLTSGKSSLTGGLLSTLKTIAGKIMTSGLLAFLTLKGIQAVKDKRDSAPEHRESASNNTIEKLMDENKRGLENAINKALVS